MLNFNVKHQLLLNVKKRLFVSLMAAQTNIVAERGTTERGRERQRRRKKKKNPTMHVMF